MAIQRQQQHEQTAAVAYVPISRGGPTISFQGGIMHVDGEACEPVRILDQASSNGLTRYAAVIWRRPTTGELRSSCNCPGWAVMRGAFRTCKHTQQLEDNPGSGRTLAEAQEEVSRNVSSVAPRTAEIVTTIGKMRRRIDL